MRGARRSRRPTPTYGTGSCGSTAPRSPSYDKGGYSNHEPDRPRKLLLHRRQIDSLYGSVREKGLTLVPTRLYWKNGRAKVELALARGKDVRDKRRDISKRDAQRQIERALKGRARSGIEPTTARRRSARARAR